jgi:hypothetical protein
MKSEDNKAQIHCRVCGAIIQPATARRCGGLCAPCASKNAVSEENLAAILAERKQKIVVDKYRCLACNAETWTAIQWGCKKCKSHNLIPDKHYSDYLRISLTQDTIKSKLKELQITPREEVVSEMNRDKANATAGIFGEPPGSAVEVAAILYNGIQGAYSKEDFRINSDTQFFSAYEIGRWSNDRIFCYRIGDDEYLWWRYDRSD